MSAHTPGSWKYYAGTHGVFAENGRAVCTVHGSRKSPDPVRDANASLIIAAPEMWDLLRQLADAYESEPSHVVVDAMLDKIADFVRSKQ